MSVDLFKIFQKTFTGNFELVFSILVAGKIEVKFAAILNLSESNNILALQFLKVQQIRFTSSSTVII